MLGALFSEGRNPKIDDRETVTDSEGGLEEDPLRKFLLLLRPEDRNGNAPVDIPA
jgi:hypothetical protein